MDSNIVNEKPTKKSGLYKTGFRHKNGGIFVLVDSVKPIETEVLEYHIPRKMILNTKQYSFKNKTNLEMLDYMFQDSDVEFTQGLAESQDHIVCRLAVLDKTKKDFNGSCLDLFNLIQGEHGCRLSENEAHDYKHRLGGSISPKDTDIDSIKEKIKKVEDVNLYLQKYISENEKNILDLKVKDYKKQLSINKKVIKSYKDRIKELSKNKEDNVLEFDDLLIKGEHKKAKVEKEANSKVYARFEDGTSEMMSKEKYDKYINDFNEDQLKKGSKVELEHIGTLEKVSKGELSPKEGAVHISKDHIAEDPAYYEKLEEVENPFGRFIEIVKSSKDFDDAFSKVKKIKDVPSFVADEFSAKYNPDGKLSMEKAFKVFYDEYKSEGVKEGVSSQKQELQDLIDLFKEAVKENPNDQESKDLLELYEENLKEIGNENKDIDFSFGSKKKDKFSIEEKGNIVFVNINSGKYKGGYIYNKYTGKLDSDNGERKDIKDYLVSQGVISESLKKTEKISIEKEHHHDIIDIEGRKFNGHYILADGKRVGAIDWRFVGANQEIILLERIEIYPKYRGNDYAKKSIDVLFKEDKLANGIIVDAVKSSIPAWVKIGFRKEGYVAEKGLMRYEMTKDEFYKKNPELIDKFSLGGSINKKLTYLGEVGGDKIWQKSSLEKAKSLEKQGVSSEEIRQETGWFVNPYDKKWRFEISDEDFDVIYDFEDAKKYFNENKDKIFFNKKLSDVVKHDKLFLAYPEFKNVTFYFFNEKNTKLAGVFIPENKEKEIFIIYNLYDEKSRIEHARGIKSTKTSNETWVSELLRISDIISGGSGLNYRPISNDVYKFRRNIIAHELQHLVQIREEFGAGSSSEWWYKEIIRRRKLNESELTKDETDNLRIESDLYYKNSSGEIEARDIDLRLDFNDKERKGIIPLSLVTVNPDFVTVYLEEPRFENGGELTAEESILNAPCINKKFKFVESSDYNEYRKGGSINSMTEDELKEFYNTKEGQELDRQTHAKWKKLVNMTKSELEKFYNSEEGKEAGLSASEAKEKGIDSGRESARWIMKMKDIPYTEWTPNMWRWAKKQIRFINRMSGVQGDLYDDNGNKTPKYKSLMIWGNNPEKYEDGGAVSFDKVISASTRFRPSETVVFDPPLEGKNGAKLISYTWSYEWTMTPNREGELKSKRISDWTQAEISADTGRDIVHQYAILMPDGEYKTVSSDSVPVLLGYLDKKELKSFPNLVTASKTLAKQQMQLAIMEAQKKEYDELYAKFEKAEKPEIKEVDETSKFSAAKESWDKGAYSNYAMKDIVYRQDNEYIWETGEYKKRPVTRDTIEQLTWQWISKRVEENGGVNPRGLYELKNRVARQKRKVENILNTKMENGGEIEDFDFSSLFNEETSEEKESRKKQEKISEEQEKEDWYQKSRFSKTWASTLKEAVEKTVKSYFDAKATYEDWGSREYKSNKGVVYAGGDDIHGSIYTIGGINENRRQRTMSGAKMQMDEAIEDLKELGLNKDEISNLIGVDKFSKGGNVSVNKVSVYQTNFSGLSFSDLGGYFDSNFTDVIDLEDKNVVSKDAPIFLFFKNPYDTRYSEKISIDDVIGAVIPKKMEKDARNIFDKRYISYVTYSDDASSEDKIESIKKLADINEDIILK